MSPDTAGPGATIQMPDSLLQAFFRGVPDRHPAFFLESPSREE